MTAADETPRKAPDRTRLRGICRFLALRTLVVYWPITRHPFVNHDDTDYV